MENMVRHFRRALEILREEGSRGLLRRTVGKLRFELARRTFRPQVRTLRPHGVEVKVPIVDLFSADWYNAALETSAELGWIKDCLLGPGDVVADCGANVGFTSVYFAKCVGPNGSVFAFEPSPRNVAAIARSAEINRTGNVIVVASAVGASSGMLMFSPAYGNGVIGIHEGYEAIAVPQIALDEYFVDRLPTALKIDVEGYEIEVLKGAAATLASCPKLAIEIHCAQYVFREDSVRELFSLLDLRRYESHIQLEVNGPIVPFDPSVHTPTAIASFPNVHLFAKPLTR